MKTDPKIELFTWLNSELSGVIGDDKVYTEIAPKDTLPSWVLISQYNATPSGSKMRWGNRVSFLVEVVTASDDVVGNQNIVNDVLSTIQPKPRAEVSLPNFTLFVLVEPNINSFTEQSEFGMTYRTQIRYYAEINQNDLLT